MPHARLTAPLAALLLSGRLMMGCTGATEPIVAVDLRTDYLPGAQFSSVRTEVQVLGGETVLRLPEAAVERDTPMLPSFRVGQALDGLASGTDYLVTVRLMQDEREVASQRRRLNLRDESVGLTFLIARACAEVVCGEDELCDVTGACVPETNLCLGDPECAPERGCRADAECTEGLACEVGSCVEGQCFYVTDRAQCGPDAVCGRAGCESLEGGPPVPDLRGPPEGDMLGSHRVVGVRRVGARPKMLWHPIREPDVQFELEIYRCDADDLACAIAGRTPQASFSGIADSFFYVPPESALPRARYAWRVRSQRGGRFSGWSRVAHFWVADRHDFTGDGWAGFLLADFDGEMGTVYMHDGRDDTVVLRGGGGLGDALAVGDVTGDGISDVIAGAPRYGDLDATGIGQVRIGGTNAGMDGAPVAPARSEAGLKFGRSVAWLADLDDDGIGDLAVGQLGGVQLFSGRSAEDPVWLETIESPPDEDQDFGFAVEGCDINADARMDIVVGAPQAEAGRGSVHVYSWVDGTLSGPTTYSPPDSAEDIRGFGATLRCVPDLTGNGNNDLLIGAPGSGTGGVFILQADGGPHGVPVVVEVPVPDGAGVGLGTSLEVMEFNAGQGYDILATIERTNMVMRLSRPEVSWTIDNTRADGSGEFVLAGGDVTVTNFADGTCLARGGPMFDEVAEPRWLLVSRAGSAVAHGSSMSPRALEGLTTNAGEVCR